jgi:hypothetical protein
VHATRDELPFLFGDESGGVRGVDWAGLRAMIIALPAGTNLGPLLRGQPNDLCPCPHWGYVLKGRLRVRFADHEEVLSAGDLFYLPPGHAPLVEEDVEFVEFSRPEESQPVLEHLARGAAAASAT